MGLYLLIIGSADLVYLGDYLWQRWQWVTSHICTLAGIIALLSNEISAFSICLITLDRLIVLRFPLKPDLHMSKKGAAVGCLVSLVIGLTLALVPVLPNHNHWQFYSQNAICLPLPLTRKQFPGQHFSFGVFIVLNFILLCR